jgi:hypothetical protein
VTEIWAQAALWLGLALLASMPSIRLHRAAARQVIAYAPCGVTVVRPHA